jgi:uncharacterized protein (DUF4213/DUF364 family)
MRPSPNVAATVARILLERDRGAVVSDVRIGLGYTGVMLEDGRAGVAYTFREQAKGGCSVFQKLRPLSGRHSSELVPLLPSNDPIEAAVGLACANALVNLEDERFQTGDLLKCLDLRSDDHVGMVGYFGPLVGTLEEVVGTLTVLERLGHPSRLIRPPEEAEGTLPKCQVAIITATSILNHTIEKLLEAAAKCREVVVLGASTPLLPEAFLPRNVTLLSGLVVQEPREVLQIVSEGRGMRYFGPHVRKVCLRVSR